MGNLLKLSDDGEVAVGAKCPHCPEVHIQPLERLGDVLRCPRTGELYRVVSAGRSNTEEAR